MDALWFLVRMICKKNGQNSQSSYLASNLKPIKYHAPIVILRVCSVRRKFGVSLGSARSGPVSALGLFGLLGQVFSLFGLARFGLGSVRSGHCLGSVRSGPYLSLGVFALTLPSSYMVSSIPYQRP